MSQNAVPNSNYRALLICFVVGLSLWFCPRPQALPDPKAWHMSAIFISTILGLIIKPFPMGATAFIAVVIAVLTNTIPIHTALSSFSSDIVWLIVFALFIAHGFSSTGLGKRIGYHFTALLGKSSLGLAYGMLFTDVLLAPAIPSATARMGGIIFPILKGIANSYQSLPFSPSSKKIAGFLTMVSFQGCIISSALFLTAMGSNPILQLITDTYAIEHNWGIPRLSWGTWALAAVMPGLASLILMPLFVYWLYPPQVKKTPDAPLIAREQLQLLGKMKASEWIMLGTIVLLLVLWIFGARLQIPAVLTGMIGVCILLITRVLDWKNLVKIEEAWETFIWFSILILFAKTMVEYGVIIWFGDLFKMQLEGLDWWFAYPIIVLIYFYSHYLFASSAAHVLSMYASFLVIAVALGTPPMLAALGLTFSSSLYGGLTHYSFSSAPLLYSAGYVDIKDWWRMGLLVSLLNIGIWGTIGLAWWKFLGFW